MTPQVTAGTFRIIATPGVRRAGLKGREAAPLLAALGIPVPGRPNQVSRFAAPSPGRCLRLGSTEFLVEQDSGDALLGSLDAATQAAPAGTLGALRSDRSLVLAGTGLYPALRQIVAFDFEGPAFGADDVVMTLMAGIGITFVREPSQGADALRLWCDPGFGDYVQGCLVALGGQPDTSLPLLHREPQGIPP
jgi:hypothetical protein